MGNNDCTKNIKTMVGQNNKVLTKQHLIRGKKFSFAPADITFFVRPEGATFVLKKKKKTPKK